MEANDDALRVEAANWLARLRGHPDHQTLAAFEAWYSTSERHADAYDALLESWDRSTALALSGPLASLPRKRRWRPGTPLKLSAAAILLILAYAVLALLRTPDRPSRYADMGAARVETPVRHIALADGSQVLLDQGAVVRTAFTANERRVILAAGRARFLVAHEAGRRFVVEARNSLVVAHGTVFDVTIAREALLISLLRGSVEVQHSVEEQMRSSEARMLVPGQQIAVTAAGFGATRPISPTEIEWTRPMLSFDDAALGDVAKIASRPGSPQLIFTDEAVRRFGFTGTIRAGDTGELAAMIGPMFDLEVTRDSAGNYLARRREKKIPGS
ncbi:FecR family protein [Rhizorhabdus sp. FW153]|uniref:FecR family protein n=1 Tax=Rhizorhabdus sp. FW153 TaxID=3400216 RepID=UPI003CFACD9B